jgi:hypothetical protein
MTPQVFERWTKVRCVGLPQEYTPVADGKNERDNNQSNDYALRLWVDVHSCQPTSEKYTSGSKSKRDMPEVSNLSELDNHRFRIGARRTLKRPLVVIILFGWFDLRKKHRQATLWASPFSDWRRWRIELVSSLHDALPVAQAGAQPVSQPPTPVGSAVLGGEGF